MKNKILGISITIMAVLLLVFMILAKANFDKQSLELCDQTHGDVTEVCPMHDSSRYDWIFIVSFAIIVLLIAFGAYITLNKEKPVKKRNSINLSKLSEDEKKVYTKIKESEGSMYQSDIVKETGFSKVKTTRILDKLETKGIIERRRRGMTNLVILK